METSSLGNFLFISTFSIFFYSFTGWGWGSLLMALRKQPGCEQPLGDHGQPLNPRAAHSQEAGALRQQLPRSESGWQLAWTESRSFSLRPPGKIAAQSIANLWDPRADDQWSWAQIPDPENCETTDGVLCSVAKSVVFCLAAQKANPGGSC